MHRQHSRRRTTRRLLLLAVATGTACVGISLALDTAAHAADSDPINLLDTAGSTAAQVTDTAAQITPRQPTPRRPTHRAKPTRDLTHTATRVTDHTRHTVDRAIRRTGSTIRELTDTLDRVTAPLPTAGRAVDTVIDLVSTPTAGEPLPLPILVEDVLTPPTSGTPTPGASGTTTATPPKAAPPPAATRPAPTAAGQATRQPAQGDDQPPRCAQPAPAHTTAPTSTTHGNLGGQQQDVPRDGLGSHASDTAATTTGTPYAAPGDQWAAPRTTSTPVRAGARAHTGRTHPPSPPSG